MCGQVRKVLTDLLFGHLCWMTLVMKEDEALDPTDISLFGLIAQGCNVFAEWLGGLGQGVPDSMRLLYGLPNCVLGSGP